MGNVTDSLDAVSARMRDARNRLSPIVALALEDDARPAGLAELSFHAICDAVVILDDALELVRREKETLQRLASLTYTRLCQRCGKSFLSIPGAGRDPSWCSAACRQAAYRARRQAGPEGSFGHSQ